MTRQRPPPPDSVAMLPTLFQVGTHVLTISVGPDWRWTVKVDGVPLPNTFETQVSAWEAGVREAARADAAHAG
jgi:hypothetical protein